MGFDPRFSAAAKQQAALLGAAGEHLGNLMVELQVAMPSLAACGFKASFKNRPLQSMLETSRTTMATRGQGDAASVAAAAVAPALGFDSQALRGLVTNAQESLAQISAM